jgi:hypothetical protein
MDEQKLNELRLVAAEVIRQLYEAESKSQLVMLQWQVNRSIEEIDLATGRREAATP